MSFFYMVLPDLSLERGEGNGKRLRGLGEVAFQLREGIVNDLFFAFIKGLDGQTRWGGERAGSLQ